MRDKVNNEPDEKASEKTEEGATEADSQLKEAAMDASQQKEAAMDAIQPKEAAMDASQPKEAAMDARQPKVEDSMHWVLEVAKASLERAKVSFKERMKKVRKETGSTKE